MAEEKIYTIPLRKGFLKAPKYDRTRRAVVELRNYLKRHLKKDVKIGKYLNLYLWQDGRQNPPCRIKVRIEELKDKTIAELVDAPREKVEEVKEKKAKVSSEKISEVEKEKTKKAIKDVPLEKEEKVIDKLKESKGDVIVEKEHAHRKEEKVMTEKTGKVKSRTS